MPDCERIRLHCDGTYPVVKLFGLKLSVIKVAGACVMVTLRETQGRILTRVASRENGPT